MYSEHNTNFRVLDPVDDLIKLCNGSKTLELSEFLPYFVIYHMNRYNPYLCGFPGSPSPSPLPSVYLCVFVSFRPHPILTIQIFQKQLLFVTLWWDKPTPTPNWLKTKCLCLRLSALTLKIMSSWLNHGTWIRVHAANSTNSRVLGWVHDAEFVPCTHHKTLKLVEFAPCTLVHVLWLKIPRFSGGYMT